MKDARGVEIGPPVKCEICGRSNSFTVTERVVRGPGERGKDDER